MIAHHCITDINESDEAGTHELRVPTKLGVFLHKVKHEHQQAGGPLARHGMVFCASPGLTGL